MKRARLFEFEDLVWFPRSIRDVGTDLLRFAWEAGKIYRPIVPILRAVLTQTASTRIVDLGSGGGGPIVATCNELVQGGCDVRVTLTDQFPNLTAFRHAQVRTNGRIEFVAEPVDATAVPGHLDGLRTLFGTLHHFGPDAVRGILHDAVDQHRPIAVFDLAAGTPPPPSMMGFMNPLGQMLVTPFVRPFRWTRLLWTYAIPVAPLYVVCGVGCLRFRTASVLRPGALGDSRSVRSDNYVWEIGQLPFPRSITYLVGRPSRPKTMSRALTSGRGRGGGRGC